MLSCNPLARLASTRILLVLMTFSFSGLLAGPGDTTVVQSHLNTHMGNYGDYDQMTYFPDGSLTYGKILMVYRLGCPPTGCSPWDYTTEVMARIPTGTYDSTQVQHPYFTANGVALDSLPYSNSPTWTYFLDVNTGGTDSVQNQLITVYLFEDSLNPALVTDSQFVYTGNYYNYIYSGGTVTDSVWVAGDGVFYQSFYTGYNVFEVIEDFELGRVMTPYANGFALNWGRDYVFDVTDYATILKDSLVMRVHYDGYSDGFSASVRFYFIEGTPPRTPLRVRTIYPLRYYEYGITTNPIENHLTAKTFDIDTAETQAVIRVIPSGHSFGGALNCAEFCQKYYRWMVDGTQRFTQLVWRNDCGLNPLWHQPGTWLYDRSNWCPGDKALPRIHELSPYIIPGDSINLDLNFDAYTYSGGAGFNPGYILSAHLVTYGGINFQTNAAMEQIIAPNSDFEYSRMNPICDKPVVMIRNLGALPLTACDIVYGIKGGVQQTFNWTGNLFFNETATVTLPSITWGSAGGTPDVFEAWVTNPNNGSDDYMYNDTMRAIIGFTQMLPTQFALLWKTNSAFTETTYQLTDNSGAVLYTNGFLSPNSIYRDTFNLASGCYTLKIMDSGKDGLSFFANNDGVGYARLVNTIGLATVIKYFEADFGTSIIYNFTVGFTTGVEEKLKDVQLGISPNPSSGRVDVNLILPSSETIQITVLNQLGQEVYTERKENFLQDIFSINLEDQSAGMYYVVISTESGKLTRKLILE
jgi:hypothetical protein